MRAATSLAPKATRTLNHLASFVGVNAFHRQKSGHSALQPFDRLARLARLPRATFLLALERRSCRNTIEHRNSSWPYEVWSTVLLVRDDSKSPQAHHLVVSSLRLPRFIFSFSSLPSWDPKLWPTLASRPKAAMAMEFSFYSNLYITYMSAETEFFKKLFPRQDWRNWPLHNRPKHAECSPRSCA